MLNDLMHGTRSGSVQAGLALSAVLTLVGCRLERRTPVMPAELVLRHGAVWTAATDRPWAEAVAVREGRLVYVGEDAGVERLIGSNTRVVELGGRLVLPGFQDNHAHPLSGGLELGECNLYDARTEAEVEGAIRAYASAHPDLTWIRGNGWQMSVFAAGNPGKELLDRLVPDRPAFLYSSDGHSAWANSRALAMAGITKDTPDPVNGRIERVERTGEPSGTLREAATDLVARKLPPYSLTQRVGAARRALAEANQLGITSITDADAPEEYLEAYAALDRRGELTARVAAALRTDAKIPVAQMASRLRELRARYRGGNRLSVNSVKLFVDGIIEARTAALESPYIGHGVERGDLNYQPDDLVARVAAFDRDGFQIHVHAIGDRAIRVTLDALAHARQVNGSHDARPIIAHLELPDPGDIPRFRELGVIANFEGYWAQRDDFIRKLTEPVLGPERSRWLYPIGSMVASGAVVTGGSDWTVSSLNPLQAIQVAITRRGVEEGPGPAWLPEERVDLPQMLGAYTISGAFAMRTERETGSIETGKVADLIVLDQNLFAIPVTDIHRARVLLTLLDGQAVWRDSTFAPELR